MRRSAYHVLRIGLGITFIWLGLLILQSPEAWASFLQPWAVQFLSTDIVALMKQTAILDIAFGVWMIIGWQVWIAALLATIHLAIVLVTTTESWSNIVVRDVGLFTSTLALFLQTLPERIRAKLRLP